MQVAIEKDSNGDPIVIIPPKIMEEMGWNQFTILETHFDEEELNIKVSQKTEWTVEEIETEDNFDMILQDVSANKTIHCIVHEDNKYVIAPYGETMDYQDLKHNEKVKFKQKVKQLRNECNPETILELINNYYIVSGFSITQEEALELIKEALSE